MALLPEHFTLKYELIGFCSPFNEFCGLLCLRLYVNTVSLQGVARHTHHNNAITVTRV